MISSYASARKNAKREKEPVWDSKYTLVNPLYSFIALQLYSSVAVQLSKHVPRQILILDHIREHALHVGGVDGDLLAVHVAGFERELV